MSHKDSQLEAEIQAAFHKHSQHAPKAKKKEKTRLEKITYVMAWFMILIMVGSVVYGAISALGWF